MIDALLAVVAMGCGLWLGIYCLHGLCDPFWSHGVRTISAAGLTVAVASFGVGAWAILSG